MQELVDGSRDLRLAVGAIALQPDRLAWMAVVTANATSTATSVAATVTPTRCRRRNFRNRYSVLGGLARTGRSSRCRRKSSGQIGDRAVAPDAVLLERPHRDPIEIASQLTGDSRDVGTRARWRRGDASVVTRVLGRRVHFADASPEFVETQLAQRAWHRTAALPVSSS